MKSIGFNKLVIRLLGLILAVLWEVRVKDMVPPTNFMKSDVAEVLDLSLKYLGTPEGKEVKQKK